MSDPLHRHGCVDVHGHGGHGRGRGRGDHDRVRDRDRGHGRGRENVSKTVKTALLQLSPFFICKTLYGRRNYGLIPLPPPRRPSPTLLKCSGTKKGGYE